MGNIHYEAARVLERAPRPALMLFWPLTPRRSWVIRVPGTPRGRFPSMSYVQT